LLQGCLGNGQLLGKMSLNNIIITSNNIITRGFLPSAEASVSMEVGKQANKSASIKLHSGQTIYIGRRQTVLPSSVEVLASKMAQ